MLEKVVPAVTTLILQGEGNRRGHAVALLVEALFYKLEGRRFESRMMGFLNLPDPSSRTMTLGSTQPLTKISTRNLPGGKKRPAHRAANLAAIFTGINLPLPFRREQTFT
jgi:hypothetical protein